MDNNESFTLSDLEEYLVTGDLIEYRKFSKTVGEGPHKIFVYGSLKQGLFLNWALQGAIFEGTFDSLKKYDMFAAGEEAPFPILMPYGVYRIRGEVYTVSTQRLYILDKIEGAYIRFDIDIPDIAGKVQAYFYPYKPENPVHTNVAMVGDMIKEWRPPEQSREDLLASGMVRVATIQTE
jgi:gamma-glutamylcyclotransferase (GGCT)/AIG2-like uncharacterized protein YtfP